MKPRNEWGPADELADLVITMLEWFGWGFAAVVVFVFVLWLYSLVLG